MLQPKDCPTCDGCGERKQPTELIDGFCKSARYAAPVPKLLCVRVAAEREPMRFSQALESVLAYMRSISRQWADRPKGG